MRNGSEVRETFTPIYRNSTFPDNKHWLMAGAKEKMHENGGP